MGRLRSIRRRRPDQAIGLSCRAAAANQRSCTGSGVGLELQGTIGLWSRDSEEMTATLMRSVRCEHPPQGTCEGESFAQVTLKFF
jgi:hypothetical protein